MAKLIEEAQDYSLEKVFGDFYAVPAFQRAYVWDRGLVRQFFDDIFAAYTEAPKRDYFIGSLVVFLQNRRYQLVDGQQRVITLVSLLAACRDRVLELEESTPIGLYDGILTGAMPTRGARVRNEPRVLALGDPDQDILDRIVGGEGPQMKPAEYEAGQRALAYAYEALATKLDDELPSSHEDVTKFARFVAERIRLVRIRTDSFSSALQIFETINARGKNLTPFELVKNYLFSLTDSKGRGQLQSQWASVASSISQTLPKNATAVSAANVRFIRYFVMSQFDTRKVIQAAGVYDRVKSQLGKNPTTTDVRDFATLMDKTAKSYARLHEGKYPTGRQARNDAISDLTLIGPQLSQHYPFLLAAQEHNHETIEILAKALERLIVVFLLSEERFNRIESNIPDWSKRIRVSRSPQAMRSFVKRFVHPEIAEREARAVHGLRHLGHLSTAAQRYILGQLTVYAQREGGHTLKLENLYDPEVTIEHVLPQAAEGDWLLHYPDDETRQEYTYMLGNLCLLSRSMNSSLQRDLFKQKRKAIGNQPYLLTKSIAASIAHNKTKLTKVQSKLYTASAVSDWKKRDIDKRTEKLVALSRERWGF